MGSGISHLTPDISVVEIITAHNKLRSGHSRAHISVPILYMYIIMYMHMCNVMVRPITGMKSVGG